MGGALVTEPLKIEHDDGVDRAPPNRLDFQR
jgi:hypothetical protein